MPPVKHHNGWRSHLHLSPHSLGILQNFVVHRGRHHSVKFTVRIGLFGLKGTHMIFADDMPIAVPEWNWLESSTEEEHETEFSRAMGVIMGIIRALRCQAITTHCIGTGCTMILVQMRIRRRKGE